MNIYDEQTRDDAVFAVATADDVTEHDTAAIDAMNQAADYFLKAAGLYDGGQLPRLEYLRARKAFRDARAAVFLADGGSACAPAVGGCRVYQFPIGGNK